jgi:predicted kinase
MQQIEEALREGRSVAVDNTNPTVEDRAPIIALAKGFGAEVVGLYFDAPVRDCLERNGRRTGKERVPDAAIFITSRRLVPPTPGEGFDRLRRVRPEPGGGFAVDDFTDEGAR